MMGDLTNMVLKYPELTENINGLSEERPQACIVYMKNENVLLPSINVNDSVTNQSSQ